VQFFVKNIPKILYNVCPESLSFLDKRRWCCDNVLLSSVICKRIKVRRYVHWRHSVLQW
jgi:hypothetical protein